MTKAKPPSRASSRRKAVSPHMAADTFAQRLYPIIAAIPFGKVTTYGTLARLAGSSRAARQVGGVLRHLPKDSTLPWHRVINHQGRISLTGSALLRQKRQLREESIVFRKDGSIDLELFGWNI
ncbi:MAG: MGMT family protein [Burkholderiales bacterium]|jgi:methylated-DNA-protein-cysteine methyltransferase-like protein|nr:MGMT family protein [Burkholderiales bacterium]